MEKELDNSKIKSVFIIFQTKETKNMCIVRYNAEETFELGGDFPIV